MSLTLAQVQLQDLLYLPYTKRELWCNRGCFAHCGGPTGRLARDGIALPWLSIVVWRELDLPTQQA